MTHVRPLSPPIVSRIVNATPEQKAEALRLTRETATTIRDLVRELDLPATSFDNVLNIYVRAEWGVVQKAESERENALAEKRIGLIKQLRDKNVYSPRLSGLTSRIMGADDGLDFADDEELADLAKQHGIS